MEHAILLILHTRDRGTHHIDNNIEIVLLTEESLMLATNQ